MNPAFEIFADGKDITANLNDRLIELRVVTTSDKNSDYVEILLDDRDAKLALPTSGMWLEVRLGYGPKEKLASMGRFIHDDHDIELNPRRLAIRAKAADFTANSTLKSPKTRSFDEIGLCDLVNQIASEHEYAGACAPDFAGITIAHIDQTAESDLNLLRRLARQHGATFKAAGQHLLFLPTGKGKSAATQRTLPSVTIQPGDITRGRVNRKDRTKYRSVTAKYRDIDQAKTVTVRVGEGEPTFEIRDPRPNRDQALADAESRYKTLQRKSGSLSITLPGNPILMAEGRIIMKGWRDGVDGNWSITRVTHVISGNGGYRCDVTAEPVV